MQLERMLRRRAQQVLADGSPHREGGLLLLPLRFWVREMRSRMEGPQAPHPAGGCARPTGQPMRQQIAWLQLH